MIFALLLELTLGCGNIVGIVDRFFIIIIIIAKPLCLHVTLGV